MLSSSSSVALETEKDLGTAAEAMNSFIDLAFLLPFFD